MEYLEDYFIEGDSYRDWLNLATSSKKSNVAKLEAIEDLLYSRYCCYDSIIINYSLGLSNSELKEHSDLLIEYYNKPPLSLNKKLKDRRVNHGLNECPFCGNPSPPDTLDHFVPKNYWPEFSIFPNNLVPQCRGCAPTKGDKFYCSNDNLAMFIHPIYSDLMSKVEFKFYIDFNEENNKETIDVKFSIPSDLDNQEESKKRITSHIKSLRIKQRSIVFAQRNIRHWKNLLKKGDFDISTVLNSRVSERNIEKVYQNWESALYKCILGNEVFLNYLNSLRATDKAHIEHVDRIELDL
ncbi:hypothetical protein NOK90_23940 [Vibrio parahaemolyticus]|uniref:hypothetical protein n=1 Tax=Vibrio parahaemolyticus TaxID=670 RepID=UPI00226B6981|nr:hypothetical protein [Vibrio parahaemolyticus]MCX8793812.1 hypothetical protein [Vibrio parahaemolyticus]